MPTCGSVCDVSNHGKKVRKPFDCPNILKRMASLEYHLTADKEFKEFDECPKFPPENTIAKSMFGEIPIRNKLITFYDTKIIDESTVIDKGFYKKYLNFLSKGTQIGNKGIDDDLLVSRLLESYSLLINSSYFNPPRDFPLHLKTLVNATGLVIAWPMSWSNLWIESILIGRNVRHVVSLKRVKMPVTSLEPKLSVMNASQLAKSIIDSSFTKDEIRNDATVKRIEINEFPNNKKISQGYFDFTFSHSFMEHEGLGSFGERLNPFGDLEAMAQAWCLTRPGGLMFLSLPTALGKSYIIWNSLRVFGPDRVRQMIANWDLEDILRASKEDSPYSNVLYVLRKPLFY
ncbi:unnamed protein product [Gordionus sp. m RMFG-2023]